MWDIEQASINSWTGTTLTMSIIKVVEEAKIKWAGKLDWGPVSLWQNLYEKYWTTEEQYNEYTDILKEQVNSFIENNKNKLSLLVNKKELKNNDYFDLLIIVLDVLKILKDNYFWGKILHWTNFYNDLKSIILSNINWFKWLEEIKYGLDPDYDFQTVNLLLEKYSKDIDQAKINDLKNWIRLSE